MKGEELVEEGIVVRAANGYIDVELISSGECEHCSAKLICKPKDDTSNILHLKDNIQVKPGDRVKIAVKGSALFKASLLLYGVPLLLLLIGIFTGMSLFVNTSSVDFYSLIIALLLVACYFSILFFVPGLKNKIQEKPRITQAI